MCGLLFGYQLAVTLIRPGWLSPATYWLRAALAWPALLIVGYVSWNLSRGRRPIAASWWMLSAALLAYAIARTLWTVADQLIYQNGVPFPSLLDVFFLLQYPFFFLGLILIPHRSWSLHLVMILDGLLFMGAAAALSWHFLLMPLFKESGLSPLARAVSLAYPVGDLFVLFGLTMILLRPQVYHIDHLVQGIAIVAFVCLILGDSWAVAHIVRPGRAYRTGDAPDLFRFAFYLLMPLAALVQLRVAQRAPPVEESAAAHGLRDQWQRQDMVTGLRLFIPIVVALLASAAIMIDASLTEGSAGWRGLIDDFAVGFALLLLVIVRQWVMFQENARLQRENEVARANEQALIEVNRRKDEFLSILSHEIRTPLASLQGYIQLLARRIDAWQPSENGATDEMGLARAVALARTALDCAQASLRRLTHLADDLTDDARIRDGRLTLRLAPCDLGAVVRAAVEEQRALEPDRVIRLRAPTDGAPIPVAADAERVAQVVANYLSNALKYSKEDQPVDVSVEVSTEARVGVRGNATEDAVARVAVRDAGPGLAPDEQAHVWERFPRIEGVAVQSGSGVSLGIGLQISKAIVEAHGGRVGVDSARGQGSTFWFTLPLATPT